MKILLSTCILMLSIPAFGQQNDRTIVTECADAVATLQFRDRTGEFLTPTTPVFWVYDKATRTVLKASTAITAASTTSIVIPHDANKIVNDRNKFETHVLAVVFQYPTSQYGTKEIEFLVENLESVSCTTVPTPAPTPTPG